MSKYIPNKQELEDILAYYKQFGTYAAVARKTGLTTTIIKRLIEENKTTDERAKEVPQEIKPIKMLVYSGEIPQEPQIKYAHNFNEEVEELYNKVIKNGGIL